MNVNTLDTTPVYWAWLATFALAAAIGFDVRHSIRRVISARNVVLVGIFMWYLLEALQAKPLLFSYGAQAYEYGIFLVLLAAFAFLAGYRFSNLRLFDRAARIVANLHDWPVRRQTLFLGMVIGLVPIVIYGLADPAETVRGLLATRHGWRGTLLRPALGDFRAAILMLETAMLGVAWIAMLILGDRRSSRALTLVAAAVIAWHLLRAYGSGSRSTIFLSVMIPISWLFWRANISRQRAMIIAAVPCTLLFYWFAAALVVGRSEGRLDFGTVPNYVGHEMFRELLFVVDQVPSHHDYKYGETLLVEIINPIPRFVWEDKPMGFGVEYASWQGHDALGGGPTLSPGIIGEMYINFGVAGIILLSIVGGVVCRAWDNIGPQNSRSMPVLMFYSLGLGLLLMMGRSFSVPMFYELIASLICISIVVRRMRQRGQIIATPVWRYRFGTT